MPDSGVSEGIDMRRLGYYRQVGVSSTQKGDNGTRLAAQLADPAWRPTREQVADLIARAFRSGREDALDEIMSRPWATAQPFDARAVDAAGRRQARRAAWDAWARVPHERDHPGGAVPAW